MVFRLCEALPLEARDGCQHHVYVSADRYVFEDVADDSGLVDHECRPGGHPRDRVSNAEALEHGSVRVREQIARKTVFRREALVRVKRVLGHSDEDRVRLFEVSRPLTEVRRFDRSARRIVHRIRPQDDVLRSTKIGEVQVA
jgi:hypothetical protein